MHLKLTQLTLILLYILPMARTKPTKRKQLGAEQLAAEQLALVEAEQGEATDDDEVI